MHSNLSAEFPMLVDSTMISAYRACHRKFLYEFIFGLVPSSPSIHLHAGATYARGLEVLRKGYYSPGPQQGDIRAAMKASFEAMLAEWGEFPGFDDHPKSFPRIVEAVGHYLAHYPLDRDLIQPYCHSSGEPAVEFTFAVPIPDTEHPETGEPILYAGRFDMLGRRGDSIFVLDDKTTSQLGKTWANQWRLRSQFTGYVWAAKQFGYPVAGAIIRGCALKKTAIDFAEAITYRPEWMIEEWLEGIIRDVQEMTRLWREGIWQKDFAEACSSYGGCAYTDLCERQVWEDWVEPNYVVSRWNPAAKEPRKVEPKEFTDCDVNFNDLL